MEETLGKREGIAEARARRGEGLNTPDTIYTAERKNAEGAKFRERYA